MKNFFEETKTFLKNSKGLVAAGAFCLVAVIFVCGFIAYSEGYSKVFPGTKVEGLDISGMTVTEAAREIEDSFGRVDEERSLEISCGEVKKTVSFGDLKVNIDSQKTARNAFDIDRKGGALNKTVNLVSSLFNTKNIDIEA